MEEFRTLTLDDLGMWKNDSHSPGPLVSKNDSHFRGPILSDEFSRIFQAICFSMLCQAFAIWGVVTNTINMTIFVKLGFKDTINISLLALAVSDFCACFTVLWNNITMNPWFQDLDLPFDPNQMHYLPSAYPHVMFVKVTIMITAFITFERCLCVTLPLRVKTLITKRRVVIAIIVCYTIPVAAYIPIFCVNGYANVFYPDLNKTVIALVFADNREEVEEISISINSIVIPMLMFISICVCTILLVRSLKKKAKWRQTATAGSNTSEISTKEQRVATMVVTLSIVFIVCFVPVVIITTAMMGEKEITVDGIYQNLFHCAFAVSFLADSINSSMNIFVYYQKSTSYRNMFDQIFRKKKLVN